MGVAGGRYQKLVQDVMSRRSTMACQADGREGDLGEMKESAAESENEAT